MKTRTVLVSLAASLLSFGAFAQAIENDDMYFTAKDRAKLKELHATEVTASAKEVKRPALKEEEEYINPTDSYSARNINPEFKARSSAEIAQSDNEDYFVNDYQYSTPNNLNNNYNSWAGNSSYYPNYYGSMNSWNRPYYGYGDPYMNMNMSPWYNSGWGGYSGWSASFGYGYGNYWNSGWGGNYGYWNDPYYNGWGSSWGGGGWYGYYPRTIVVVERNRPTYGKRASRSSSTAYRNHSPSVNNDNNSNLNRGNLTTGRQASRSSYTSSTGRTSSSQEVRPAQQQEYYNRSWRRVTQQADNSNSSGNSSGRSTSSNNSFFNNSNESNSSWSNGNSRSSSGNSSSRSSGSSFSGGSRSSGSSSSGSSGSRSSRSH